MENEKVKTRKNEKNNITERPTAFEDSPKALNSESLNGLKQQMIKKFGAGTIFSDDCDNAASENIDAISTGLLSLDAALGIGGIPCGRIIEIYGPESSGKTTLTLNIIANYQMNGGVAAFIDAEHALDIKLAKKIGIQTQNLLISQPGSGEESFEICSALIKSGIIKLIVIDSVAALVPRAEIEATMNEMQIGLQARLMASGLRRITSLAANNNCTVIFINQLRDKIGVMFGNSETTPGGRALKFFSSIRLEVRKIEVIKNAETPAGIKVRVKVTKNKCAMPFKSAELDLMFNEGFSAEADMIELALAQGVIEKNGAWYSFDKERIGQGRENIKCFLKQNEQIFRQIEQKVKAGFLSN
ncbi:MAG: recombinase RecA [Candidatus Wallbacteria bacterium]